MEKALCWWTESSANWKDKWIKVKSERNKARDEVYLKLI